MQPNHLWIAETDNDLANESDGYKNVNVVRKFSIPDQELLQYVHDGIVPGSYSESCCL